MTWAEAVPNLLIGLREGLEAGLVVSILLAALRKTTVGEQRVSTAPVWLGVLGAVMVAGSFAAVLTFSTSVLSSAAQEAVGGLLSVLAVGLVTAMVFWMRRTASGLAAQLRGEVERAVSVGTGALAVTAFLAVGREGLETTLFLWTAAKASGSTLAPLVGAGLGLAAATVLCWLLYRQALRLNLGVFFSRTALALVVIAAGVLAYGLGDLQDAEWLPGYHWVAFDLTAHIDPNSWWVSIMTGVTELAPRLTMLQIVAWAVYLAVVVPAFVRAGRPATAQAPDAQAPATSESPAADEERGPGRWERLLGRRPWAVAAVLVVVPALAAATTISMLPSGAASSTQTVTVTQTTCAKDWTSAHAGTQTFEVENKSGKAGEINLVNSAGAVVGEIETIGPATTAEMTATLGNGSYTIKCLMSGQPELSSATVQVSGAGSQQAAPAAVAPVTVQQLTGPNNAYQAYAAGGLTQLSGAVAAIGADLRRSDLAAAKNDWLTAQLDWERVGASYDSFGDAGTAVDGLPDGLPGGVQDKDFTGLHRLEYGLWHGQSAAQLMPVVDKLSTDIATVRKNLGSDDLAGDPTNLPIRAHEILEDAMRDHLSGIDDQGAGAAYPETYADLQVTRTVLGELSGLLTTRAPALIPTANQQMDTLQSALLATRTGGQWRSPEQTPLAARQSVNAAVGALLETLDQVPDLLEVPPTH
ncbi:FTR1 family protein [Streptomyces sp. RB6PN25]|uniref:FTR1 family protein n=1 Tax=Streptomyces humicola TaxID=2953240 RepID=A0ABT1Q384_9ACTN|nr:iron uptake transporter permease EfeU [Streptomyces humicola]MCQ4083182.1 FTR1 family protein [Streptomyces humicola]